MKFCDACGAANEDYSATCYECGAELTDNQPTTKRKGSFSIPKPVLLIGAAVLVVALIVGVIVMVFSGADTDVASAYDRTRQAFLGDTERQTQLERFFERTNELLKDGDYTITLELDGSGSFELQTDYARGDKQLQGSLSLLGMEIDYSATNKVMQFTIPGSFDNVYGLKISQIEKYAENPVIGNLLSVLDLDLDLDFFVGTDLESMFEDAAGTELKKFKDSVEIRQIDDRELNGKACQVYEITWSSDAFNKLIAAVGSVGKFSQLGDLVNTLVPELEPECRCYVDSEGYLVGLDFVSAGVQCLLSLEGGENPWDSFTLTVNSVYGEPMVYRGALERSGYTMKLHLSGEAGTLLSLEYNDASGDFSLYTQEDGLQLSGRIYADSASAYAMLEWGAESGLPQSLSLSLTELEEQPEQLAVDYIDLLDLSIADMTRLVMDLKEKLPEIAAMFG